MAQFLEFKPNDAQSEVREVINNNFKNATLKPSENSGKKFGLSLLILIGAGLSFFWEKILMLF